jgi:hypothetical protein
MKTHLNLLPWTCRRNALMRTRALRWTAVWIGVAALTFTVFGFRMMRYRAAAVELGRLQEDNAPLEQIRGRIAESRTRLSALSAQEVILARLATPRPALTLLALVSRSVGECDGLVQVEQLALRTVEEGEKAGEKARPGGRTTVVIKGIALDNMAASRFVMALRNSKSFDRVELKSSIEEASSQRKACAYLVECGY